MSKTEHLLISELHALAAERIENGEKPFEFVTVTVGLWGDSVVTYSDLKHLADSLHGHAEDAARLAAASDRNAQEFRDGYGEANDDDDGCCADALKQASEALGEALEKFGVGNPGEPRTMHTFDVGDVVSLKSGGPRMTVVETLRSGDVSCRWFCEDGEGTGSFPPQALRDASTDFPA